MKIKIKETKIVEKELTLKEVLELPNDKKIEEDEIDIDLFKKEDGRKFELTINFYSDSKTVKLADMYNGRLLLLDTSVFDTPTIIKVVELLTENLEICEEEKI